MVFIGLIYRPPKNNHEDDSKLNSLLIAAEQQTIKKQLLVLGDFIIQRYDGIQGKYNLEQNKKNL